MHPLLFKIGPIPINTYGALIVIGFFLGLFLILKKAQAAGLNKDKVFDMSIYGFLAGLIGARILYVITQWESEYKNNPLAIFKIYEGGVVFYGGLIGGILAFVFFC